MKASELRIGNYITRFGDNVVVDGIDKKHRNDTDYYIRIKEDRELGYWLDQFKPIVLTEEILLKCGLEKRKDGNFNLFKQSKVDIVIDKEFSAWKCDGINFSVGCIKYLHQLQNLYFALTGEELNIKL